MSRSALSTVALLPIHALQNGAVSGRHRRHGRKPAASAAAADGKNETLADRTAVDAGGVDAGIEPPVIDRISLYHVNPADALVISEALLPRIAPSWPHGQTLAEEAQYVGCSFKKDILWVACRCCRLRAGDVRLGPRLLRPSGLPAYGAGGPGLVAAADFGRGNNPFLVWRLGGRQSAEALQEIRRLRCHQGRMRRPRGRHFRMGDGRAALAAVPCDTVQRRRMGHDGAQRP